MNEPYNWIYENSINVKDQYVDLEAAGEHKYKSFRTNKIFSNYADTVIHANLMNIARHLDNKLQYDYLYNSIRKKKRTFKNRGKKQADEDFTLVQSYYKYSSKKTYEALAILTEAQLAIIRKKMDKGGIK